MTIITGLRHSVFTMTETGTIKGVTTPRALSLTMGVLALIGWASFAYAVNALRDSPVLHDRPVAAERASWARCRSPQRRSSQGGMKPKAR